MKKNKNITIKINKKKIENIINHSWRTFKIIIGAIAILISFGIFIKILIPLLFASIGALFLLILDYYNLTDPNFKMIWAFFMLVVVWKLFGIFSEVFFIFFDNGKKLITKK